MMVAATAVDGGGQRQQWRRSTAAVDGNNGGGQWQRSTTSTAAVDGGGPQQRQRLSTAVVEDNDDNESSGHWQWLKATAEGNGGRMMGGGAAVDDGGTAIDWRQTMTLSSQAVNNDSNRWGYALCKIWRGRPT